VRERALEAAARSDRPRDAQGVALTPLDRRIDADGIVYSTVTVAFDRAAGRATITVVGPDAPPPETPEATRDATFWPLRAARELDDALMQLRLNEPELGLIVLRTAGDPAQVLAHDAFLEAHATDWFIREVRHNLKRVLKRLDMTSRSLIALMEPGSCFAGWLAELAFAADRSVMLSGSRAGDNRPPPTLALSGLNFGPLPMGNGLTRLQARFWGEPDSVDAAQARLGEPLDAGAAEPLGLVTLTLDETDWDDEVRIMLEERASFSPDALTAMEANLRFVGPETMETRIFGRLTAWQNWVFQRPSAAGEQGALKLYGSGVQPTFDRERV